MSNDNNSIRPNSPQRKPLPSTKKDDEPVEQQAAGKARTSTPEQEVFQNANLLSRIIEQSDSPATTSKTLHPVNKASRQASTITQQGQSLQSFSAENLLAALDKTKNQTSKSIALSDYLEKAPIDSPLRDIDITLSPKELLKEDIRSTLIELQKSRRTSPIKVIIEVKDRDELQSFIDNNLPFLQENPSILRAIQIDRTLSISELQNGIAPLAQKLQYTTGSKLTPTIKLIPIKVSLNSLNINEFLNTDLSALPENLHISQLEISFSNSVPNGQNLTTTLSSKLKQQLNNLPQLTKLNIGTRIPDGVTFSVPSSVTSLEMKTFQGGNLEFPPDSKCSSLFFNYIWTNSTLTLPPSATLVSIGLTSGNVRFAPDSQFTEFSCSIIPPLATLTLPPSVTKLTIKNKTYTAQELHDLKSGTTSLPNVFFGPPPSLMETLVKYLHINELFNMFRSS